MPGYVYILQSNVSGRFYVGSSADPNRRFKQHLSGQVKSTKAIPNLEMVFTQEFASMNEAKKAEMKIKSWKRHDFIEKIIQDGRMDSV